jgi:hypothetical protein
MTGDILTIWVRGGQVYNVTGLQPGQEYKIIDFDNDEVWCPAGSHWVTSDASNRTTIEDHGRCWECQRAWQFGELEEQQEVVE